MWCFENSLSKIISLLIQTLLLALVLVAHGIVVSRLVYTTGVMLLLRRCVGDICADLMLILMISLLQLRLAHYVLLVANVILLLALELVLRHHLLPEDGLSIVIKSASEAWVAVHVPRVVAFLFFFLVRLLIFVADFLARHTSSDDCSTNRGSLLISDATSWNYVRLYLLRWCLVGDVPIDVAASTRTRTGQSCGTSILLILRWWLVVVRCGVVCFTLQMPHITRLHIATTGLLLLGCCHSTVHHVSIARVAAHIVHLLVNHTWLVLIILIHAKPRGILICKFELGLVALALASLSQGIDAWILDVLAHVFANMLGIALF